MLTRTNFAENFFRSFVRYRIMGNIHTVGPNEAVVVSGGCCGSQKKKTVIGGWAWAWACVTDVQTISLEVMTLNPVCEKVETAHGVPITVTGVAQVKIMTSEQFLAIACEQFLGKTSGEISQIILQTLEGHLRAILGTLSVEAIYQDRVQFAQLVRDVATTDVCRMGIEILSFTIKDVYDDVDYLKSLGRTQTANVKRDAAIGVAQADRDAGIREAECEKEKTNVKYKSDTQVADAEREFKMKKAQYDKEINTQKAQAELAYELQAAKEKQAIKKEEIEIQVVERRAQIAIEEQEIKRREKELEATVKSPAAAEAFKIQTIAEADKFVRVKKSEADANKIRMIGEAEASATLATGSAEAERMRLKADAYKQYGEAAKMSLVLECLPKVAAEVAAPLRKVEDVVIIGDDRTTADISRLAATLPTAVGALTGIDITKAVGKAIA